MSVFKNDGVSKKKSCFFHTLGFLDTLGMFHVDWPIQYIQRVCRPFLSSSFFFFWNLGPSQYFDAHTHTGCVCGRLKKRTTKEANNRGKKMPEQAIKSDARHLSIWNFIFTVYSNVVCVFKLQPVSFVILFECGFGLFFSHFYFFFFDSVFFHICVNRGKWF